MAWYLVKPRDNFTFSIIGLQMDMNSVIDKKWTSSSMRSKQSIPKLQDTFPQIKFISSFYDNYELQTNTSHIHSISTSQPSPRAPFLNRTRRARCKIGAKVGRLGTAEHFVSRRSMPPPPRMWQFVAGYDIHVPIYTSHLSLLPFCAKNPINSSLETFNTKTSAKWFYFGPSELCYR
jgi:hypothetical protein